MAQGFVKNLNLVESDTTPSDRSILDNLGGINISKDILLFDGNSRFTSTLKNNQNEIINVDIFFGTFVSGKKYKIIDLGDGHNWNAIGANSIASVGELFVATGDGDSDTGLGGIAKEVYVRKDFEYFYDNATENGIPNGDSLRVVGLNKIALSSGTVFSITAPSGAVDYSYKVHNSNGENVFQIIAATDTAVPPTILNINTILSALPSADIDNVTLTRSDVITSDNIGNMKIQKLSTNDEADGGGTVSLGEEGSSDEDDVPLTPLEQISYIGNIVGRVKYKRSRTPLNYLDNQFDIRFRLNGLMKIENTDAIEIGYPRTLESSLVVGKEYEITTRGNATVSFLNTLSGESRAAWALGDKFIAKIGVAGGTSTTRVKATTPPGLFISIDGNKTRAFSGTENPWETVETGSTPSFISGGALRSVTPTESVRVKDLVISNSASAVDLLKTNTAKDTIVQQVADEVNTIASYTHKLPIIVNGEQYYILTKKVV